MELDKNNPSFTFPNSQVAWEKLNEGFFNNVSELKKLKGTVRNGSELELHNIIVNIKRAWVKPSIDFGNYFGYRRQKWTTLVNNYIDNLEIEAVGLEVMTREKKRSKNYNISMNFSNNHGHGKQCLLNLTFSRVQCYKDPIIIATMRSSEITKRLLLDFLLIQRIGEKVYGQKMKFSITLFASKMYSNGEALTMYNNHRDFREFDNGGSDEYQVKIRNILDKFIYCDLDTIKYKVHKRCVRQLQRDKNGHPLSGDKPMLAKQLKL